MSCPPEPRFSNYELREIVEYLRSVFGRQIRTFPKFQFDKQSGELSIGGFSIWKTADSGYQIGKEWYSAGSYWDPPDGGVDDLDDGLYSELRPAIFRLIQEIVNQRLHSCWESISENRQYQHEVVESIMEN